MVDLGSASWSNPIGVKNITSSHTKGQQNPGVIFHFAKTTNQVTLGTVNAKYGWTVSFDGILPWLLSSYMTDTFTWYLIK